MSAQRTDETSPHLTVPELAARWRTTVQAIYNARHRRNAPPAFRRGGKLLFPLSEVIAFERNRVATDAKAPDDPALRPPEPTRPRTQRKRRRPVNT